MLKLQEVATFAPMVNVVVGDLLRRVEFLRRGSQDGVTVSDIASELYKFGFEGSSCFSVSGNFSEFFGSCKFFAGISAILFETRLGCLEEKVDPNVQRFITAVNDMLSMSDLAYLVPRWTRGFVPVWRRFIRAWDDISDVGEQSKRGPVGTPGASHP